ncbi:MAG TPA: enoyl-CoA hydratase-related protein [Thermomicrobiaceae bacterium]|nr:enoyl-CoA hydratase-related protein [Thermomicrobiaceae bacterium]
MAVEVERSGSVAFLTLSRPEVLNAFNTEQLHEFLGRFGEVSAVTSVRAIVIRGAGDRAFASGADIAEMKGMTPRQALAFSQLGQRACHAVESATQPVIAAVNGYAFGGGLELALACDIRICADSAQMGQTEVGLGILPGWGGTQRLTRLAGPGVAKDLILTGRRVAADEALRLGLVSAVYPAAELIDRARELAERVARNAPVAVGYAKQAIEQALEGSLEGGLAYEAHVFALTFDTTDQKDGMAAFLERRRPEFQGS